MEIKILKEDKKELDVEINNLTIAELLRAYLNQEDVKLAAWRRDHPTKNPVLHIEADNPTKVLIKAISAVQKKLDKLQEEFKKSK
jgi:DNA-directed RNA polymerase subunit L